MDYILHPWQLLLFILAGWVHRQQQQANEYLRTENQVLKEKLGKKRILLNDNQRGRLAVKGKVLGCCLLPRLLTSASGALRSSSSAGIDCLLSVRRLRGYAEYGLLLLSKMYCRVSTTWCGWRAVALAAESNSLRASFSSSACNVMSALPC